ncbi:MAG: sugar phosphate nucleotidyltransferase [Candidatus Rokuibacteriota bacterium]
MTGAVALETVPLALLAGGLGTRIRPVAGGVPKAMLDVAGRPFIAHVLELLRDKGVRRVVVCTGHLGDQIERFVGDGAGFGLAVRYSREAAGLLGTAGALRQAAPRLGELFWVMYGDTYLDVDFREIHGALPGAALGLMTVFRNDNRLGRSNVRLRDGRLVEYDKRAPRPDMTHIDYGLALLRRAALAPVPSGTPADLADLYQGLVAQGAMAAFEVPTRFYEVGSPEGLAETRTFLERRAAGRAR